MTPTTKVTCRFCRHRRHPARMFHWFADVWECIDLINCEAIARIRTTPMTPNTREHEATCELLVERGPSPFDERVYHRRLGIVVAEAEIVDPNMRMSRVRQICRTWRSHVAWHLCNALARTTTKGRR